MGIAQVVERAPFVAIRNQFSGFAAHAQRIDRDACAGGDPGLRHAFCGEVFSVGDEDEQSFALIAGVGGLCFAQGFGDIGSARAHGLGIGSLQCLTEGIVVQSGGALQEGFSGKCNQAHAVAFELTHEIENGQF